MKIERRRIGNDVTLTWKLLTNGERTSLSGRDLKVTCTDAFNAAVPVEWTVSGMDIVATVRGKNQRTTGVHTLKLIENDGKNDQHVVDVQCFELVDHSWKLDISQAGDVIVSADVSTSLSVAEIEAFRRIAADIPGAMEAATAANEAATAANEAATAANEAATAQLRKGVQRYNNDWWNMNCLLEPGFYEGCWRGRPADCTEGEMFACIVTISKRADQNDGVDVVTQVAMSSRDAQRVFTRKILTRDRSVFEPPTTVYEDWKLIGADDKATLLAAIETVSQAVTRKQDIINDLLTIRSGAAAGATAYQLPQTGIPASDLASAVQTLLNKAETALQEHQDISGKLDKAKIGISGSGLKKDTNDNVVGDVYNGHAGDIIGTIQGQNFDKQLIDVFMLRWVLSYFAKSQDVYTTAQVDSKETALSNRITSLSNALDTLIGEGDVTQTIDSFNEVVAFLNGITDTTLDSLLSAISYRVKTEKERAMAAEATKQDIINDLAAIRSGAAAGATAYQLPQTGIPASDLAEAVQSSLNKVGKIYIAEEFGANEISESSFPAIRMTSFRKSYTGGAVLIPMQFGSSSLGYVPAIVKCIGSTFEMEYVFNGKLYELTSDYSDNWTVTVTEYAKKSEVTALEQRVSALEPSSDSYYVEAYDKGTTDATPVKSYGMKTILRNFDFYLLDTTDNAGSTTTPVGKYRRNNLLRFADGSWAPVVGITQAQAADALLELFAKEGGNYVQYCAAGEYDAEDYVDYVLRPYYAGTLQLDGPELYKSDGEGGYIKAHALCPWETTETKYTIGIGADRTLYILDNVEGDSGFIWKGIFTSPVVWDGIDVSGYALPRTAIAPCPSCTIDDNGTHKMRNFFYLYQGDTNCRGAKGLGNVFSMFAPGDRTYPRTLDVAQVSNMNWARANNADPELPLPFAEGGYFALDAFIIAQELLYSRRNPFVDSLFGSGISSNDTCNTEATWRTNGGVRYKKSDAASPTYNAFSATTPFYYNTSAARSNWSETLNQYAPKEQCMESQIVASFIKEFGLKATTNTATPNYFYVYGGKYYWMKAGKALGPEDGYMNVRVYRELNAEGTSWYDASGNAVTYDIAVVLRMSLMAGANLSGDIFAYWGGGAEVVGTCGENSGNGTTGHTMDYYLQPDQSKWMRETAYTKNNLGRFDFEAEGAYPHLGQSKNLAAGYALQRMAYLPKRSKTGGGISQGECYYTYEEKYWSTTVNQRARVGLRFRGYALYGACSPRNWYAYYAASLTARAYGGSAQARIG